MKKLYFLVAVLFTVSVIHSQVINFPNPVFKSTLLSAQAWNGIAKDLQGNALKIDANNNGEIEINEALQVGSLNFYGVNPAIPSFIGIENFTNLTYLNCEVNISTTVDLSSLVNLEELYFTSPFLTSINVNGLVNLKKFNCSNGQLTSLDVSSLVSLENFDCGLNQITTLNLTGLGNIVELSCGSNQLTTLDLTSQTNLKILQCDYNQIQSLNLSNQSILEDLSCSGNALTSLDVSNLVNILMLNCSINQLTTLDISNLTMLKAFQCTNNQLTSLSMSNLPNLKTLYCHQNQLTSIDLSDLENLIYINCSFNELQALDLSMLPNLQVFEAHNNELTVLNCKNGGNLIDWSFHSNPNLEYICANEEMIEGIKMHADVLELNCEVNSYCSFTPGGAFYTIDGNNKFDINNNGCDLEDISYPNLKLAITGEITTGNMISDTSGHYNYSVQAGTYTLAPIFENPSYFTVTPENAIITFPAEATTINQNFCIMANEIHPDLEIVVLPTTPAIPGFNVNYHIIIKNKGNIVQSGSITFNYDAAVLDYVSSNPIFSEQGTNSMTWNFANLLPFETRQIIIVLNLNSPMETPAVNGGDVLNYTAAITSNQVDDLPLDNTFTLPQIVVNSFDPNDKTCLEGTSITPDMMGKYVHYMIRFENTGTFAAQNIVVKDMIDTTKFDVSSLVALNGSHPYVTRITGNKVEFIFENINLPFDDANNDGYVVFKIKTLPTLALGDSFSNSASIYFDYNHPIITEPAVTTFAELGTEDFVFNSYFTLYPNPTAGVLSITTKEAIEMQSISIYNVLGQMVVSVPNAKDVANIDVSSLSTGNYFIKIFSDKGTSNAKFIKQ